MKIATILPLHYMHLEATNDYHMALAHLVGNGIYRGIMKDRAQRGDFILMDNGVVETGQALDPRYLVARAFSIMASEIILPDVICDGEATLRMGESALHDVQKLGWVYPGQVMAVPQGRTPNEWEACLREMLAWPVDTIGISKFTWLRQVFSSRWDILKEYGDYIDDRGKKVHLLGCVSPLEIRSINLTFPWVRGVDSGYPAFCAAGGQSVDPLGIRPDGIEKDFDFLGGAQIDEWLMTRNYHRWLELCRDGSV